jgi:hypothetical protein
MFGPIAPPVFMEVSAPSQDRERSFIYVFGVSTFCLLDLELFRQCDMFNFSFYSSVYNYIFESLFFFINKLTDIYLSAHDTISGRITFIKKVQSRFLFFMLKVAKH